MHVLITGGAGFIGYHLARYHVEQQHSVTILDSFFKSEGRRDDELRQLEREPGVKLIEVDLARPLLELPKPPSIDIVYHLAAINGTRLFYEIPYQLARTNLAITLNVLEWIESVRVGRLVYSSTSEVYAGAAQIGALTVPTDETAPVVFPQPTDVRFSYGASKFMGEFLCFHFGRQNRIPVSVIRYHNIYGPRMGNKHVIPEFCMRLLAGENPFRIYGGNETRAFCYVDDAVRATHAVAKTAECDGQIVHIGNSKEEVAIEELALTMMEIAGTKIPLKEHGGRSSSVQRRCPDTRKLKELTGYEAEVALHEGLRRTMAWYARNAPYVEARCE